METSNLHIDRFSGFLEKQNMHWPLSAANYLGLEKVEEKEFGFENCRIRVQFNPERIRSSAAKTDQDSIAARPCFLCNQNRPAEQLGMDAGHDFLLLVNPYPIFRKHFTLTCNQHINQRVARHIRTFIELSRWMEGYTLFYNGPECGASAPDHLHFQAGENGFMPVEEEFSQLKKVPGSLLVDTEHLKIRAFDSYLRKMISFESESESVISKAIETVYDRFREIQSEKVEPMINLLSCFREGRWEVHLFPREKHRPWQFFEQGEKQLLISPASVDFGGVFIMPRREDFDKIQASDVEDIFSQVTLSDESFNELKRALLHHHLKFGI